MEQNQTPQFTQVSRDPFNELLGGYLGRVLLTGSKTRLTIREFLKNQECSKEPRALIHAGLSALRYCNLSVNHSEEIQLTTASKGKVLRRVRKYFGVRGVFKRSHEHEQRGCGFVTSRHQG